MKSENYASFIVTKNDLSAILKQLLKIEKSAKKKKTTIELTIINDKLLINIPGVNLELKAITYGTAKLSTGLAYLAAVINDQITDELNCTIQYHELKINLVKVPAITNFFEDDTILRSINLPINYTYLDVLKLVVSGKYTIEEIKFNQLNKEAADAVNRARFDLQNAIKLMSKFGFSRTEIVDIIRNKLQDR